MRQRLTDTAHERSAAFLQSGDIAVDATAGNGHDTCFLAKQVGPEGTVFACDIQQAAIDATARRLLLHGLQNVVQLQADHANLAETIPAEYHGRIAAVMFNLGYLPGGEKSRTTQTTTTQLALEQSLQILRPGGLLSVLAYTGHPGGREETDAVRRFFRERASEWDDVEEITAPEDCDSPPQLFIARKR